MRLLSGCLVSLMCWSFLAALDCKHQIAFLVWGVRSLGCTRFCLEWLGLKITFYFRYAWHVKHDDVVLRHSLNVCPSWISQKSSWGIHKLWMLKFLVEYNSPQVAVPSRVVSWRQTSQNLTLLLPRSQCIKLLIPNRGVSVDIIYLKCWHSDKQWSKHSSYWSI